MSDFNFAAASGDATASAPQEYYSMCGCSSCFKFSGRYDAKPTAANLGATSSVIDKDDDLADAPGVQTLVVDGPELVDTINAPNDVDFFKVELKAGQTYDIGQFLVTGGPSGVPLGDAFFEIFDATGKLIASADGGGPDTPSGLDALLTFTAEADGVYSIRARSFDNDGTNGPDGDFVGDYKVFVKTSTAEPYVPYYDTDSPLHSLDWGTQLVRSSRNPDGAEGPRPTGNPAGSGTVIGGGADGSDHTNVGNVQPIEGKTVITYYFANPGDAPLLRDPTQPGLEDIPQGRFITEYERAAYRLAFSEYERVADVKYVEVTDINQAYFKIFTYSGTPGAGASLLGRASPPGEAQEGQMEFNAGDYRYNEKGLTQGGFFFPTLLHEMGHAHGLAHPHDNGGRSSVMRGGGGGTGGIGGAYGDFELSQGIFTMMSYNDGWDKRPDGTRASPPVPAQNATPEQQPDYGFVGTFGALDIALLQDKYGVNEEYNRGDDVYQLKDVNAKGTFYATIWDGGGVDQIRYDGARAVTIDLRAATLLYETGGGGFVSYAREIQGGFTIANGVVIENAYGGGGADILVGNAVANQLAGGAGNDQINGGDGDDRIFGEDGGDTMIGGQGADGLFGQAGTDHMFGEGGADTLHGGLDADLLYGQDGDDVLEGQGGADLLVGGAGQDYAHGGTGNDRLFGEAGGDKLVGGSGEDQIFGQEGADTLFGEDGADLIGGGADNDVILGQGGGDRLLGEGGADRFVYVSATDSTAAQTDRIMDFDAGQGDLIDLSQIDANTGAAGNQAFSLVSAFTGQAGQAVIVFAADSNTTVLFGDIDGDARADFVLHVAGTATSSGAWVL